MLTEPELSPAMENFPANAVVTHVGLHFALENLSTKCQSHNIGGKTHTVKRMSDQKRKCGFQEVAWVGMVMECTSGQRCKESEVNVYVLLQTELDHGEDLRETGGSGNMIRISSMPEFNWVKLG